MENLSRLVLILSVLVASILAMPRPDAFDDEGEMSVPRSPKIQGPDVVNLPFSSFVEIHNLQCLIEASPTPTVIWLKDGQEIKDPADLYNMTYDATDGKADLCFLAAAKREEKYVTGNFSCIAANFLGRAQKTFVIEITEKNVSTPTTTTTTENIASTDGATSTITKTNTNLNGSVISTTSVTPETTDVDTNRLSSLKPEIINASTETDPKKDTYLYVIV